MRAIILAAGVGNRLAQLGDRPKCLLEFGGETLLARHLKNLLANGIDEVTLCLGHRAETIMKTLDKTTRPRVNAVINADYREGSVVSLWTARATLRAGEEIILMDADVLYAPAILTRLVHSRHANCFLLDRDFIPGDEPVKLCLRDGAIVEFRKKPSPDISYDSCGESVGFFKFSPAIATELAAMSEEYLQSGRRGEPYEELIRDLILADTPGLAFEDVTGLPWIEIDFPEDVARAEHEILPAVEQHHV